MCVQRGGVALECVCTQGHCGTAMCVHIGSERMGLHTCVGTGLCKGIGMHECVQTYGECMDKCMLAQGCAEELCCTHVHTNRCCLVGVCTYVFQGMVCTPVNANEGMRGCVHMGAQRGQGGTRVCVHG